MGDMAVLLLAYLGRGAELEGLDAKLPEGVVAFVVALVIWDEVEFARREIGVEVGILALLATLGETRFNFGIVTCGVLPG